MIIIQNYAGNKQKSYIFMRMKMFATMEKAKPDTENIRGLNLAAVKHKTVEVTRPPLQGKLLGIGHNLLYRVWADRGFVYTVYTNIWYEVRCK
jgi:hypothetical protein